MTGERADARRDRARARRDRRLRAALVASLSVTLAGAAAVAVALGAGAGDPAPSAALPPSPVPPPASPASSPAEVDDTPRGIVLRTDPAWVARVSEEAGIPTRALSAYAGADLAAREEGCAVGWNTLAAIGLVESEHGTLGGGRIEPDGVARPDIVGIALDGTRTAAVPDTDGGALDGDARWDRAVGPMQFIPQTWREWGADGDGDGVADIHDIDDAALTAARYLCHAQGTLDGAGAWIAAVRSYNDSSDYQDRVAEAAAAYAAFG